MTHIANWHLRLVLPAAEQQSGATSQPAVQPMMLMNDTLTQDPAAYTDVTAGIFAALTNLMRQQLCVK